MLYSEIIAVCSQIHTKHINTLCGQNVELLNVKLAVHKMRVQKKTELLLQRLYCSFYSFLSTLSFKVVPSTGDKPFSTFFHCWNASWNALSVMVRSSLIAFSFISMVWKTRPFKVVLFLGNGKKSSGAKSGK